MANFCNFEIRAKGSKKAVIMIYASMPCHEGSEVKFQCGTEDSYEIRFVGTCNWSVNYGVSDTWDLGEMDLTAWREDEIYKKGNGLWGYSLKAKSGAFHCEIQVHYWSEESEFDQFDQYVDGRCVKQRKIEYNPDIYMSDDKYAAECAEFDFRNAVNRVYEVGHIQEQNRNRNIETIKRGERLTVKCRNHGNGRMEIEVFSGAGLTLGYLRYPAESLFDNIEYCMAIVESVEPLSKRRMKNSRNRVALLDVRIEMDPDKREAYEEAKRNREEEINRKREAEEGYFNWNTLEFVGHEGEYDESVDGEESDLEFMRKLLSGLSGETDQESSVSDEEEKQRENILSQLDDLIKEVEDAAAKEGVDLYPSAIGDTGYDLYCWTFNEGKKVSGDGWAVSVPDGFEVADTEEDRDFVIRPIGYGEKELDKLPICIFPGIKQASMIHGDSWCHHSNARSGVAGIVGVKIAKMTNQFMGTAAEVFAVGWDDICAYVLLQPTSAFGTKNAYTYQCAIVTEEICQQMRIQTHLITEEQKKSLSRSIIGWLKTFRFDKPNPSVSKVPLIEIASCMELLKKGKLNQFRAAIEQAKNEYVFTVNGWFEMLRYHAENGLLDSDVDEAARDVLKRGFEVKEYYLTKIDSVLSKLRQVPIGDSVMKRVYKKLHDLDDNLTEIYKTVMEVPAVIRSIQNRWEFEEKKLNQAVKKVKPEDEGGKVREQKKASSKQNLVETENNDRASEILKKAEELCGSVEESYSELIAECDENMDDLWDLYSCMSQEKFKKNMERVLGKSCELKSGFDPLIRQINKDGKELLAEGGDYRTIKKIKNLIDEILRGAEAYTRLEEEMPDKILEGEEERISLIDEISSPSDEMIRGIQKTHSYLPSYLKEIQRWWWRQYDSMPEAQVEKRKSEMNADLAQLEQILSNYAEIQKSFEHDKNLLEQEIACTRQRISKLEENAVSIESEGNIKVQELQGKISGLRENKAGIEKSAEGLQSQINRLSFFKFSLKKELTQKLEETRAGISKMTEEIRLAEVECESIKKKYRLDRIALSQKLDDERNALASKRSKLLRLSEEQEKFNRESEIASTAAEIEKLKAEIAAL